MAVIGSEKQEKKIAELSQIAQEHYPGHQVMSFKGAFRMGAQKAVQKSGFNSWDEVAQQPATVRRQFFNTLLQESRPHLLKITGEGNVDQLLQKLKQENEKYLQQ
ncbi:MAG: hypothetical protein R6U22_01925 [Desulfohalobiaceae bacterium]